MLTKRVLFKRGLALVLLLLPIALVYTATRYPLKAELEMRLVEALTQQGLTHVEVRIGGLTENSVYVSHISFTKENISLAVDDVQVVATSLPYKELLRKNYGNVAADWTIGSLVVSGLPYEFPAFSGSGKATSSQLTGELHDASGQYGAQFDVTFEQAVISKLRMPWQGARVTAPRIVIALGKERKSIHIPLHLEELPLNTVLSMMASGKASGTGLVSGNVELTILPNGGFSLGKGQLGTHAEGVIQLAKDALPGDSQQVEMTRRALSDFHYKDLSIRLSPDNKGKVMIQLNLEGNNPQEFDGRPVKLNVNLTGDVLELLQQTILPLGNPEQLIQGNTP